jgi:serine/threonine-protein kinase haspin
VREAKSVLAQIAGTLAVGESALKFEHRDMHRGNILVRRTKEKDMIFIIDSRKYVLPSEGVHVTVIDYTLSRLSQGNCISYNDLNNLPWLFKGKENDIQHQTYLHMQNCTNNDWSRFAPKTNAYWLYYIATKMSIKSHVKNINRSQIQSAFRPFLNKFLKYGSAKEIFLTLFSRPSPLREGRKL